MPSLIYMFLAIKWANNLSLFFTMQFYLRKLVIRDKNQKNNNN